MSSATKPPFRIPSIAEINAVPWNGLSVISTFSGCGGSSLGYRMAGFRVLWANEFVPAARDSYNANKQPHTILDGRDIRKVTPEEILAAIGMQPGELDLMDGSPPCASFSTAGKREAHWGKSKKYSDQTQRTDDLFFEFTRLLKGIQPKAFVAENVSGLVKGTAKGYFLEILAALKACGYRVEAKLLDAQWLGVPQMRQRIIFVGVRQDLRRAPAFPRPLPYRYSVRDALPWIASFKGGNKAPFDSKGKSFAIDSPSPTVMGGDTLGLAPYQFEVEAAPRIMVEEATGKRSAGLGRHRIVKVGANAGFGEEVWQSPDLPTKTIGASPHTGNGRVGSGDLLLAPEPETDISRYAIGKEWDRMGKAGTQSDRFFSLVRPDPAAPCPTVTGIGGCSSRASITHPYERRKFTIAELRRICAFPDDFVLTGGYAEQWERLGRAVPPVMMRAIAEVVRDRILLPTRGT